MKISGVKDTKINIKNICQQNIKNNFEMLDKYLKFNSFSTCYIKDEHQLIKTLYNVNIKDIIKYLRRYNLIKYSIEECSIEEFNSLIEINGIKEIIIKIRRTFEVSSFNHPFAIANNLLYPYKKGDNWLLNSSKENTLIFVNDDVRVEVRKGDKVKYVVHEKNCISFCENDNELVEYLNRLGILEKKSIAFAVVTCKYKM